jgi:hypothetical protein
MNRRRVLAMTITGGLGLAMPTTGVSIPRLDRGRRAFFVAGVRYHTISKMPATGDPVRLVRVVWRGEPSLEVRTMAGARIGFVPRSMLSAVGAMDIRDSRLSAVDRDAVSWKRYEVTVRGRV